MKYASRIRARSAPLGSSATPSSCTVISWSHPMTNAILGSARRLRHLRLVSRVSKTISSSGVTAMPTTAACGSPDGETVDCTPRRCFCRNGNSSARVMVIEYIHDTRPEEHYTMKRTAEAQWQGDLKTGVGEISMASGTLSHVPYSFHSRFEQGKGT